MSGPIRKPKVDLKALLPVVVGAGILLGLAFATGAFRGDGETDAGVMAATACTRVVEATREARDGTRSMASLASVLRNNEDEARDAAREDPRYLPIAEAIVSAQADIAAGRSPTSLSVLIGACGG